MTTYFQRLEGENQQIRGAGRETGGTGELNLEHTTCLNVFTLFRQCHFYGVFNI